MDYVEYKTFEVILPKKETENWKNEGILEIIFDDPRDAETVLVYMEDILKKRPVSVYDLKIGIGWRRPSDSDKRIGWLSVDGFRIRHVRRGHIIVGSEPIEFNEDQYQKILAEFPEES